MLDRKPHTIACSWRTVSRDDLGSVPGSSARLFPEQRKMCKEVKREDLVCSSSDSRKGASGFRGVLGRK